MQSKEKKNIIFVRLFPDENVNEQLMEVCISHDVRTAVVISGIGQLKNTKLGYIETYYKRRRYLPVNQAYKGLNSIIQGTAGDYAKFW